MAQVQLPNKVHKAAIAIVPPLHITHAIQRIRCFKDKSFVRWPPHINLLYPFLEDAGDDFAVAATKAAAAVAGVKPFKLRLTSLSFFEHGRNSFTMWLKPEDTSSLCKVQSALEAAFPGCDDLSNDPSRGITSFTPHMSLGQWRNKQQMMNDMQVYQSEGLGLEFEVQEVCIMSRQGYTDPFNIRYAVPLGTSISPPSAAYQQPQLVDVPYLATTAANLQQLLPMKDPTDRARFGLGAAACGIWNFAYGANMSPKKLGGSRGLHPLESKPGVLKDYSLRFTHRGGFGNVVKVGDTAAAAVAAEDGGSTASTAAAVPPTEVHGVLHHLSAAELATLMSMEHEYWPVEVSVLPYATPQQQQQQQQWQLSNGNQVAATTAAATTATGNTVQVVQPVAAVGKAASSGNADEPSPAQVQQKDQIPGAARDQQTQGQQQQQQPEQGQQQQQQQPILAVAFMSPPERCIRNNLPTIKRYLDLLIDGAQHWRLPSYYTAWLQSLPSIPEGERGQEYYTSAVDGQELKPWPKIRTGSQQQQRGPGRGRKRSSTNSRNSQA